MSCSRPLWLLSALALGGCAAAMPGYTPPEDAGNVRRMAALKQTGGGLDQASSTYRLSDQEQKLDCKHLNGGITIKILQMREASSRYQSSATSKSIQKSTTAVVGGTTVGLDNDRDYTENRARLEALNRQLVAKSCKSFDLDAQLKSKEHPKPTVEAKKG